MKRIIISGCIAAIAVGLVAVPASAATKHFHGSITGGGKVAFDATFKNGKPKSATAFSFTNVPVRCSDTSGRINFSYSGTVAVNSLRKFSYTFHTFKANFNGTIKTNGNQASGKMSYGPNTLSGHPHCTTGGAKAWTASS